MAAWPFKPKATAVLIFGCLGSFFKHLHTHHAMDPNIITKNVSHMLGTTNVWTTCMAYGNFHHPTNQNLRRKLPPMFGTSWCLFGEKSLARRIHYQAQPLPRLYHYCWWAEIRRSPVEVGSWPYYLRRGLAPSQVVIAGFLNHQQ